MIDCLFFVPYFHLYRTPSTIDYFLLLFLFLRRLFYSSNCSRRHVLFSHWLKMLHFDNAKRMHTLSKERRRERKEEKSATNNRGEAWSSCTLDKASISTDLYLHTHTHTCVWVFGLLLIYQRRLVLTWTQFFPRQRDHLSTRFSINRRIRSILIIHYNNNNNNNSNIKKRIMSMTSTTIPISKLNWKTSNCGILSIPMVQKW